jgi:hypothetical protein
VFLLSALWALFAGMRLGIGGYDYANYNDFYAGISGWQAGSKGYYEPLFKLTGIAAKAIGFHFHDFLAIVALLGILPSVYVIDKRCEISAIGLFAYGMEWMLYASFVILRQGMAMGLALLAVDALFDKKRLRFILVIIVAGFFHSSAFVFLPLAFFQGELRPRLRNALFVAAAALFLLIEGGRVVLDYGRFQGLAGRLLHYLAPAGYERLNPLNIVEIVGFWFLVLRYAADAPPLERNMYFFYTCLAMVAQGHAVIIRFGYYYEFGLAFLLPRVASSKKASGFERILVSGIVMAYLLAKICRWLLRNAGGDGGFLPYRTIFG